MILETDIDKKKWGFFVRYIVNVSDLVSFTIVYKGKDLDSLIKKYEEDLVSNPQTDSKIYHSGDIVSFRVSDRIKQLLISRNYKDWQNSFITDPSFYNRGYEIVASVIHEDFIIFNDDFNDYSYFVNNGFLMNKHIDDFGYKGLSFCKWIKGLFNREL